MELNMMNYSQNYLIQGDNSLSLRILNEHYNGKIDVIYIDPHVLYPTYSISISLSVVNKRICYALTMYCFWYTIYDIMCTTDS